MNSDEVDKETIIASSSDTESEDNRRQSKRSRSRDDKIQHSKKRKRSSTDSSGHYDDSERRDKIDKRDDRSDKYDKNKNDKDVKIRKSDHSRHHDRERDKDRHSKYDRRDDRRRSDVKDNRDRDRDRNRRRSRSRSHYKNKRRSRSINSQRRHKSRSSDAKSIVSHEIKKKFEDIARQSNYPAPISTSDSSKHDVEMFVGNLPDGLSPTEVTELMNTAMVAIGANVRSGNPILSTWMSSDGNYAFLEFRTPEEARNSIKLDGISLLGKDMFPTLTSFEKDMNNPYLTRTTSSSTTTVAKPQTSITSSHAPATSKLLVSNLPLNFNEDSVYKFLRTFGKIKSIEMIKDPITGQYSGQCHVEFETEASTSNALQYAMGINLQGNILYIKRSSGLVPVYSISSSGPHSSLGILTNGANVNLGITGNINPNNSYMNSDDYIKFRELTPSKVIMIKNMCTMKELEDDDEYDDLYDDVLEECKNYGKVISVKIPRYEGSHNVPGLGKVFVEYYTREGAAFAKEHLNGKNFHGRTVEVVYHPEDMFKKSQLD